MSRLRTLATLVLLCSLCGSGKTADYDIIADDKTFLENCYGKDNKDYLSLLDIIDISGLQYTVADDLETIYVNGNIVFKLSIPDEPIKIHVEVWRWDRGVWKPTLYSMNRPNLCQAIRNPLELWHSIIRKISDKQLVCPPQKDGIYTFRNLTNRLELNNVPRWDVEEKKKFHQLAMPYSYVVSVDFEATCWEKQSAQQWRMAEIIEFPAVLVNLKTGKFEAEFHKYVRPMESPRLSRFCTELTGIQQKTVDNGVPLCAALRMFHDWLLKELRARNLTLPKMHRDNMQGNCAFVTWTDWDFGMCLARECSRKHLRKAPYFNQWIDGRAIYRDYYNYRPCNFTDALTHVGLAFEGRAHSGIDDAKNLGSLMYKMVRDGAIFSITKDLTLQY
ncbi:ERI1 exoribonuclease 2 [Scaptodrosophila lebanonensis]|uniref:ERI1 exoribonuclease 2 n=1 Tax=Drosophila lebanonensis TaxID=7225 RepID=A0A6J2TTK5_DROLE|nr:ERI1 exoribonuclease 2 [Scaptodrosophila lebanonensis]